MKSIANRRAKGCLGVHDQRMKPPQRTRCNHLRDPKGYFRGSMAQSPSSVLNIWNFRFIFGFVQSSLKPRYIKTKGIGLASLEVFSTVRESEGKHIPGS